MDQQQDQDRNKSIPWNKWKWEHNNSNSVGFWDSNPKREIHSITGLSQKQEKVQINNLTLYLKELVKYNRQSSMWVEGRK